MYKAAPQRCTDLPAGGNGDDASLRPLQPSPERQLQVREAAHAPRELAVASVGP